MKTKDKITVAICTTAILLCGTYLFKTEVFEPRSFHHTVNKIKIGFTHDEVEEILNHDSIKYKKLNQDIIISILPRKFSYGFLKIEFDKNKKVSDIQISK
jgi:hypothetical protein